MSQATSLNPIPLQPEELAAWLEERDLKSFLLLDVRERDEVEICQIPRAEVMPLSEFPQELAWDKTAPLVVCCHHGVRSYHAGIYFLQQGFEKVYNLEGGVERWAQVVDPTMPRY